MHAVDLSGRRHFIAEALARSRPNEQVGRNLWLQRLEKYLVPAPLNLECGAACGNLLDWFTDLDDGQMIQRRLKTSDELLVSRLGLDSLRRQGGNGSAED
jgi:hypothetical protein